MRDTHYVGAEATQQTRHRLTDVDLVFDPPWNQTMMSEAARLETGML